ncbi:T9SS type B sorting domain-containing protein, partial [Flavobacterium tructae]|uniref:T9SS type B sorting domain-containing protein n=1 Tax=Flavobacterium tructae TaxID=1114873 RepID=UPI0013FDAEAB
GTCESPTRLAVTVTLSDPKTPTTTKTTQEFCKTDNKTVADLAVNESGVTWYDAATAGNVVASTTTLENNKVYYGSLKAGTCESSTRLVVTVTLSDPKTPTTSKTTQEFCKADNKTVANLAVNESGVTWYDAANNGNVIAATTTLEDNKVYYGSLKAGICESPIRLAVKALVKGCTVDYPQNWNATACVFDEATYKVSRGMSDYNWIVSKEGVIVAGGESTDDYVTVIWNSAGKATVKAEYIDVSKFDPLVLIDFPVAVNSCSDVGLKKTVDNPTPGIGHQVVFTITAENLGTNVVKEVMISEKLPSGYDYVTSQTSSGSYNSIDGIWMLPVLQAHENQTLKITAKVKELGDYLNIAYLKNSNPVDINEMNNRAEASIVIADVTVYNAISINGDGLNDYFKITGLHNYPNNTVEIFNRNGVQIFKTHNYGSNNNVFRGISEGRATISKKSGVPTGTYFYILRYERAGVFRERAGYLYVSNN